MSLPSPGSPRAGLLARFDLSVDQAAAETIDGSLRNGAVFQGTSLWLLIFAIIIASVGLNVNSTAVIIGAMLISPLMGPIMGVGYGAAVADFRLVRLAVTNLAIAGALSIATSAAYFWLTPLSAAHSELLARTSPSIWDVLIALAGGLAGIIGSTRREKSNVIPGVAIATALMPPLCTAGYGIATGNLAYFSGAFYLFVINSVYIAAATFVMVRVMRLPEVAHADALTSRRAHRWIAALVITTAVPSLFLAQRLVAEEVFATKAAAFLAVAIPPQGGTFPIAHVFDAASNAIRVTVIGAPITIQQQDRLAADLGGFGLAGTRFEVQQSEQQQVDVVALRRDLTQELYRGTLTMLDDRNRQIGDLETRLAAATANAARFDGLPAELRAQHPELGAITVATGSAGSGEALVVVAERPKPMPPDERARVEEWLRVRTSAAAVWFLEVEPGRSPAGSPPPPVEDPSPDALTR